MNKVLNIMRATLSIIIAIMVTLFSIGCAEGPIIFVFILFCIFWGGTTIMELIRKQGFSIRHNILSILVLGILLIIITRPYLDFMVFGSIGIGEISDNVLALFEQNKIYIWITCFCLFLSNYVDYKFQ